MTITSVGIVLCSTVAVAAATLAADQVVVDRKNACQMSVPAEWKLDTVLKGSASSADNMDSVVLSSTNRGQSLTDAKAVMQQMSKPVQVLEDSAQRFWYEYVPPNNQNGKTRAWYVGIPVKGNVCGAQITMKDGNEAAAKSIAMSVKPK
jgi:hypothetical protein